MLSVFPTVFPWDGLVMEHVRFIDLGLTVLNLKLQFAYSGFGQLDLKVGAKLTQIHLLEAFARGAALAEEALDDIIKNLESWMSVFGTAWILMAIPKLQLPKDNKSDDVALLSSMLDSEDVEERLSSMLQLTRMGQPRIRGEVLRRRNRLVRFVLTQIPFSDFRMAKPFHGAKPYVMSLPDPQKPQQEDMHITYRRLMRINPLTSGLLVYKGAAEDLVSTAVHRLYKIPEGIEAFQSLRQVQLDSKSSFDSLPERLRIAQNTAKSLGHGHALGFVHRGICPESILVPDLDTTQPEWKNSAFLLGLEPLVILGTSTTNDGAVEVPVQDWCREIYMYPLHQRRGSMPLSQREQIRRSIYGLGVCLLEIGLCRPFVTYTDGKPQADDMYSELREWLHTQPGFENEHLIWLEMNPKANEEATHSDYEKSYLQSRFKEYFVHLSKDKLRRCMGSKYAAAVEECLTFLDLDQKWLVKWMTPTYDRSDEDIISMHIQFLRRLC